MRSATEHVERDLRNKGPVMQIHKADWSRLLDGADGNKVIQGRPFRNHRLGPMGIAIVCLSTLFLVASARGSDWPTYRHDAARSGATTETLTAPLKRQWVYSAPSAPRTAWSGPNNRTIEGKELRHRVKFDDVFHTVVVGDRVFFGSSVDHQVYCLDLVTGRKRWSFFTGGPVRLAPTVWKDRVFFGSDDGYAYCLDAVTGQLVWKLHAGPAEEWLLARGEMISRWPVRTGVLVDRGIAYFGAGIFPHEDVFLYAVRADDGTILWKRDDISESDAGRDDLSPQGYLLASEELLFVPSGRSLPAALDRKTGDILYKRTYGWRGDAGGVIGGTRALLADGQIYAAGPNHLLAMEQKTGDVGFGWFAGRQMAVSGDSAYVATGTRIARLDRPVYAQASRQRHQLENTIYDLTRKLGSAGDKADEFRAQIKQAQQQLKAIENAGVVWQKPSNSDSALIATDTLAFLGGPKQVAAFQTSDGEKVWQAEVDGDARGLAVANEHLLVSTTAGKVYCFGHPGQEVASPTANAPPVSQPFPQDAWTAVYRAASEEILNQTGQTRGFCLVLGSENGRLAYELAKHSDLKIYGIEPDEEKVAAARQTLSAAGLYGHRVTVHHGDPSAVPYSDYFANLIVSDRLLRSGKLVGTPSALARHVKPLGGVVCLGRPAEAPGEFPSNQVLAQWLQGMELGPQGDIEVQGNWVTLTRGALPGAGSWTQQYGNPGNTAASDEKRVKGGLGVLWYGDPGPGEMVNRHEGAVGPLSVNGRLFVQGQDSILAYDAYNGLFLWKYANPQALRTGVFQNQNPGNLAAGPESLFHFIKDQCFELDAATGKRKAIHRLPTSKDDGRHEWGYVAFQDGLLFGTATIRQQLAERLRRRGRTTDDATDAIFAIDTETGKHLWTYQGKSISHRTIALGPQRVFFIDSSITSQQRDEILRQDKTELKSLTGQAAQWAEERMKNLDVRRAVALDALTGKTLWEKPVDVTDCSEVGTGGGRLTLMYEDGVLILCGANANGHYWQQFVAGEFSRRRLVALSSEDGYKLWAKDANYRHRPIIVGGRVIAEPWAFDLRTGEQQMRIHPLTGEEVPWSIMRPGHHCGMITGCDSMLFFRSGYTGFYDLKADAGTRHFAGHRLGCWINAFPANGLVMIPEASAGCVCLFSIASTIVMEPREPRRPWAITSAVGAKTPVKHMALNLGAPGDRRDVHGTLWLAYPRPNPRKTTSLDLTLDLKPKFRPGGRFASVSADSVQVANTDVPWIYTSWGRGITRLVIPLLGKDDPPATYALTLHFAAIDRRWRVEGDPPPSRQLFDVRVQGRTVLKDFDVAESRGVDPPGTLRRKALVRHIDGVKVTGTLVMELVPAADTPASADVPILNALEIVRTGSSADSN